MRMQIGTQNFRYKTKIFNSRLRIKVIALPIIVCTGKFAMFSAHALREGCGHAHI